LTPHHGYTSNPPRGARILRLGTAIAQMRVQKLTFAAPCEISGRSQQSQLLAHDLRAPKIQRMLISNRTEAAAFSALDVASGPTSDG
jgi:hypothetical protein